MASEIKGAPSGRVVSIDAVRGFDMLWITGGATFLTAVLRYIDLPFLNPLIGQFEHSAWNGFTFYDLIFPLFLFIVGASMPFALGKRLERGDDRRSIYRHVIRRSLTLLFLGFLCNGLLDFQFAAFRYTGVLHRIAVCYFITALIVLNTDIRKQAAIIVGILFSYWAIMKLVPVPGFGAGVLTPEGNLAAFLDRLLLPGKFCCYGFGDNEGILSTVPAVATTLIGVLSGHWLKSSASGNRKAAGLALAGVAGLVLGLLWGLAFPINKLIWTSSYVIYSAGWSCLLLALFYWLIDIKGCKAWAFPFVVIGLNPITIYVAQDLFDFGAVVNIVVHGFINYLGPFKPVLWAAGLLITKWLFLYFLYKKRIFLKA